MNISTFNFPDRFFREKILIAGILIVGAIVRFYRMRDYLVFLGDEGRDVLVVKRIIVDHIFTMLGPVTSVGGMFLGPIYYYMMTPFLWLFHFDPVGPAIMVGCLSLITIYLLYRLGREFLNPATGIIAALLYATSPLVIIYSRSSWNPNAVPLFALLIIYGLLKSFVNRQWQWLFVVGLSFGVILQLHYLALLFSGVFILLPIIFRIKINLRHLGHFFLGVIITFSPFIFFELRHGFPNTNTIFHFIADRGTNAAFSLRLFFVTVNDVLVRIFWQLVIVENALLAKITVIAIAIFFAAYFFFRRHFSSGQRDSLLVLLTWLVVALGGYGLYTGAIYNYYFVPVFPLPFLIVGFIFSQTLKQGVLGKWLVIVTLVFLIASYFYHSPHRQEPNRLLTQSETIAHFVLSLTNGRPYNFALVTSGNSDHAYRYFFELWGKKPVTIENAAVDPQRKSVSEQLIVICENKDCQPLGNPLWEVAGFGKAEVTGQWDIITIQIFKLEHIKSGELS